LIAQRAGREFAQAEDRTLVAEGKRFKEVDTQPDLFPETRATERATPATFQRLLKSKEVTEKREAIAEGKAVAEQTKKATVATAREVEKELSPENIANEKRKVLQEIANLVSKTRNTIEEEGIENAKTKSPKYKQLTDKLSDLAKDIDADKLEFEVTSDGVRITYVSPELLEQWARLDTRIKNAIDSYKQLEARAERAQGGSLEQRKAKALAKQQKAAADAMTEQRNKAAASIAKQQRALQERLNRGLDLPGIRAQRKSREELAKEIGEARAKAKEERKAAKKAGKTAEQIAAIKTKVPSKFKVAKIKDRSELLDEQRAAAARTRKGVSVVENLKAIEQQEADAVAELVKAKKEVKDWRKLVNEAKTASDQKTFKQYEPEFYSKLDELAKAQEAAQVKLDTIRANKQMFSELRDVEYKTKPSPRERVTAGETKPAGLGVTEQQMYEYGIFGMSDGVKIKTSNPPEFAIGDSDPTGEIDVAEAKKFLADVKAKAAKQGIKVKIYPIAEVLSPQLYGPTLAALGPEAARRVKGGVDPDGTVFFVIESHNTLQDLKETVAHELIGHYTFEGMLGERGLKRLLNRLEKTHGNISKLAEKIGGQDLLRKVAQAEAMMKKLGKPDDEVRMRGLNELVAYTMEKRVDQDFLTRAKQWLQELVGAIRLGLRDLGIDMGGMSTSELFYLMRQADRNFKAGKPVARIESDGTVKYSVAAAPAEKTGFDSVIADRGEYFDRAKGFATGMTGLAGRVKFLDRFAAIEAVMKKGLSAGEIDSLKAADAMYFNRMADQRNNFVAQFATGGVAKIVIKKGERIYESAGGASLKDVSEALAKSGLPAADVEREFTAYIAALRVSQIANGLQKLSTRGQITAAQVKRKDCAVREQRGF